MLVYQPYLDCKNITISFISLVFSIFRVKQTSLLNNQQYTSAKQGLEFAQTAIKTTQLSHTSQKIKLDNSFRNGLVSKDDYDQKMDHLKRQFEIDSAPWGVYVEKLSQLIEQYSSQSEPQQNNKRLLEQSPSIKKTRKN
jgi:hypothetical protein